MINQSLGETSTETRDRMQEIGTPIAAKALAPEVGSPAQEGLELTLSKSPNETKLKSNEFSISIGVNKFKIESRWVVNITASRGEFYETIQVASKFEPICLDIENSILTVFRRIREQDI